MFPLDPSDAALIADLMLASIFALYFALGRPRVWYRDRLGWVIFGYALSVVALLGLIVYGIVFGQKVDEPIRLAVALGLAGALVAKTWSVYRERRAGRLAGERPFTLDERIDPMSNPRTRAEAKAVAAVAAPWYPVQRVLRSIVGALVVLIPLVNGVAAAAIAYLNSQTDVAIPPVVFVWLNAIVAGTALIIGLTSRIMAVPGVNAALTKIGLGSVPKSAIVMEPDRRGVYVLPDPKAPTT